MSQYFEKTSLRKAFKLAIKAATQITGFRTITNFRTIQFENKNIFLEKNDDILILANAIGAIIYKSPNNDNNYIISVANNFDTFPKYVQDFLIYHECGHIQHLDKYKTKELKSKNSFRLLNILLLKRVNDIELEADGIACKMIGKTNTLKALKWLEKELPYKTSRNEIRLRYKNINDNF